MPSTASTSAPALPTKLRSKSPISRRTCSCRAGTRPPRERSRSPRCPAQQDADGRSAGLLTAGGGPWPGRGRWPRQPGPSGAAEPRLPHERNTTGFSLGPTSPATSLAGTGPGPASGVSPSTTRSGRPPSEVLDAVVLLQAMRHRPLPPPRRPDHPGPLPHPRRQRLHPVHHRLPPRRHRRMPRRRSPDQRRGHRTPQPRPLRGDQPPTAPSLSTSPPS